MRTVAIVNQKGGCGKTTTAINLAGVCARTGYRTLLVDLDPQSHCAAGLAIPEKRIDLDIGDAILLDNPSELDRARLLWRVSRNLDLAPSRMKLAGLEAMRGGLADRPGKERALAVVLGVLARDYDVCLIDCSPSIGLLTYNALAAATEVLIPVETGFFALQGAARQVETIKTVNRRVGLSTPHWLLPTMHDPESFLAQDLLEELRRRFGKKVLPVVIRRDPTLQAAASFGQPAVEYAGSSPGASDYSALAWWMIENAWSGQIAAPSVARPEPGAEPARPTVRVVHGTSEAFAPARAGDEDTAARPINRATDVAQRAQRLRQPSGEPTAKAGARAARESAAYIAEPKPRLPPLHLAEHLFGARQTRRGMLFVQPITVGGRVFVSGDFNGWSADATEMRRNESLGVFEACVPMAPGRHEYRLIIDGQWTADPYNNESAENPFGGENSVVNVTPGADVALGEPVAV